MEVDKLRELVGLTTKQIILPDTSRGFEYARWKSPKPIQALRSKGLTQSKLQKELKLIHDISSAAYHNNEVVCSHLSFQLLATFLIGTSLTSFIIFVTSLVISSSLPEIKETLDHSDLFSVYVVDSMTLTNLLAICGVCSTITLSFGFLGVYIMNKAYKNSSNQYIACILSVHEHINYRLFNKYKNQDISWKLFIHKKDTKRSTVCGTKREITYYGIVIKIKDKQMEDNVKSKEQCHQYYNVYNANAFDEYETTPSACESDDYDVSQHVLSMSKLCLLERDDCDKDPFMKPHI
eukprot:1035368_1